MNRTKYKTKIKRQQKIIKKIKIIRITSTSAEKMKKAKFAFSMNNNEKNFTNCIIEAH